MEAVCVPFAACGLLERATFHVPLHGWFEKSASNLTAYCVLPDSTRVCEP